MINLLLMSAITLSGWYFILHSLPKDILAIAYIWLPSFTAKIEIKSMPFISNIAILAGTHFMDRVGTSESRDNVVSIPKSECCR